MIDSEEKKMKNKKEIILSKMEYLGFYLSNKFPFYKNNKYVIAVHFMFAFSILLLSALLIFFTLKNILDSHPLLIISLIVLSITYKKAVNNEEIRTEDEINKFGNILNKFKPDNSNLIVMMFFSAEIIVIIVLLIFYSFSLFPLKLFDTIGEEKISDSSAQLFANFGNYFGGTVGTLITICAFGATLYLIFQQQKQINVTENSHKQQQLESNFFILSKKLDEYKNDMYQFYILLKIIFQEIYQNSNKNKMYIQRYADILKTYLHNDILEKMICEENMKYEYHKNDSNNLYFNIKNIIEDYSLFQYLKLDFNTHSTLNNGSIIITKLSNDEINKEKILIFKISAFYGNKDILPIRISLEKNPDELKKYGRDAEKIVRQAVAKNPNTPQKTLVLLSKDTEKEVRQAAINTINFLKSQNDENN